MAKEIRRTTLVANTKKKLSEKCWQHAIIFTHPHSLTKVCVGKFLFYCPAKIDEYLQDRAHPRCSKFLKLKWQTKKNCQEIVANLLFTQKQQQT